MSLSGLRPWPEERLAEFGRRQYYGVEAGAHDAQGRIDRCACVTAVLMMSMMSMLKERALALPGYTASVRSSGTLYRQWNTVCRYPSRFPVHDVSRFYMRPWPLGYESCINLPA